MKKLFFLCMLVMGCATFVACGDDDDDEKVEKIDPINTVTDAVISEKGNQLVLTYTQTIKEIDVTITNKLTCTFQNDRCVSAIYETTYPTEQIARMSYEDAINEEPDKRDYYSLNGKVVIYDMTSEFEGLDKATVKRMMQGMANM